MKIEQINQEIIDETYCLLGFGNVHRTAPGIHRYRTAKQWFSIDRHLAYDVTPHETIEDKTCHRFTPVVVGGCTFHSLPDVSRKTINGQGIEIKALFDIGYGFFK